MSFARLRLGPAVRGQRVGRAGILAAVISACSRLGFGQPTGVVDAHDPSTVVQDGSNYYYYATGQGIISRTSTDLTNWTAGPSVFATAPSWTTTAVPGFTGFFWAPDVIFRNNQYYLYYAVSTFGSKVSAIGLATSPTLNPSSPSYAWTDQGAVIQSGNSSNFNAIDPSILQASDGRMWMSYGSYNSGIFVTQMDPNTGKILSGATSVNVAYNSSIEASALIQHGGYYYLMVNWGGCCAGINSTYEIRMGRSTSPTGPFLDQNGANMLSGGGTIFYDDDGSRIGPGQFSFETFAGQDQFSYHYYDGNRNGAPTFGLSNLYWTADGWPSVAAVNPNWTGGTSANWSSGGNWSGGTGPGAAGSIANFGSNTANRYTVNVDVPETVSRINFSSAASYTIGTNGGNALTFVKMASDAAATINVSAGNHTIAAPISTSNDLGINVTPSDSTLTLSGGISGANLYKYGFGTVSLNGTSHYSGQAFVHAGTLQITGATTIGTGLTAGQTAGDVGTIIVSGNGSVSVSNDLNVGDTGDSATPATGTLVIKDNAAITVGASGAFVVGAGFFANTMATGTVQQSGGTLTANGNFDGAFIIGGRGSSLATGTYTLSGGAINANTNVQVGGYGNGTFNQSAGTFTSNYYVSIGRYAGATGNWNISGGLLNVTNAGKWLLVGESGTGSLTVSGSGQVTTANVIRVGHAGGAGVITLNGGTLTTLGVQRGTGTATINFNGGTLKPTSNSATFLTGLTGANVQAGGAVIDTNGQSITIGQLLAHDASLGAVADGGLKKNGVGVLTLSAANTYTGITAVAAGTLNVTGSINASNTANAGEVIVGSAAGSSGTMNITNGMVNATAASVPSLSIGDVANATGTLGMTGGALTTTSELWISGAAGSHGTFNLTGGTVKVGSWFVVGRSGADGNFNMSGGTLNVNGANATIASFSGASGQITLTGGTMTTTNAVFVGEGGNGLLNVSGTASLVINGSAGLRVASNPGSTGTVNLGTGGTITAQTVGSSGTGTFSFNGGTLRAGTSSTTFFGGLTRANIRDGGALIDTNGFTVTIAQPLLHSNIAGDNAVDGGLSKNGSGTLTLTGTSSYTGPTVINGGQLLFASAGSSSISSVGGAGTLHIGAGTSLTSDGVSAANWLVDGTHTVRSNATSAGTSKVGALSIAGATNAWTGTLDLTNNGLIVETPDAATKATTIATLQNQIAYGTNHSLGIVSSTLPGNMGVAVLDNGITQFTTFRGLPADANSVLVSPELLGDANADGHVDQSDLSTVLNNFGSSTPAWTSGNFDNSATIDLTDLADVLNNFGQTNPNANAANAGTLANPAPEPASLLVMGFGIAALFSRRSARQRSAQRTDGTSTMIRKECGCKAGKRFLNGVIPGAGDFVAAIADPIAQKVVNPAMKKVNETWGTNFQENYTSN